MHDGHGCMRPVGSFWAFLKIYTKFSANYFLYGFSFPLNPAIFLSKIYGRSTGTGFKIIIFSVI